MSEQITIIDLPEMLLEIILSYLSYDEIAKYRIVCRTFNEKCKQMLNKGFTLMERTCNEYSNVIQAQIPEKNCERLEHPLVPASYLLDSIKLSFVKLILTYDKYIQFDLCCFIPGKIIDEYFRIIQIIKTQEKNIRLLTIDNMKEIRKEFDDIIDLATEHFENHVQPILDQISQENDLNAEFNIVLNNARILIAREADEENDTSENSLPSSDSEKFGNNDKKYQNQESRMRKYIQKIEKQESKMKKYVQKIAFQDLRMQEYIKKIKNQDSAMQEYARKIRSHDWKMLEYSRKIQKQNAQLVKVSKSLDDLNQKLKIIGTFFEKKFIAKNR